MAIKNVGDVVLTVNGVDLDITAFSEEFTTGFKKVKTMNKTGKTRVVQKGSSDIQLSAEVIIPDDLSSDIKWEEVEDAVIVVESESGNRATTYTECYVESFSNSYQVDGETARSVNFFALDKVEE